MILLNSLETESSLRWSRTGWDAGALCFFGFLLLIGSRSPSVDDPPTAQWNPSQRHYARPMPFRQGEQLNFQPQPGPAAGKDMLSYKELNIPRHLDDELVQRLQLHLKSLDLKKMAKETCQRNVSLEQFWSESQGRAVPKRDAWERFYAQIGSCDLYRDEQMIQELLNELATQPLKHVAIMEGGTQVKLVLTFENDKQAVFKPMRFGRDYETDPNHFYFGDFERHNAEIATFHIDKILGFRRAVPTTGRVLNITSELLGKAERKLKKTFFVSPVGNQCFVGKCDYYCDTTHAICGTPDLKEGSVQVFLPDDTSVPRRHNKSPYRRTYSKKTQLATWQTDMRYCSYRVKNRLPYGHGRRLLDLVDLHIMDYLIGNQDRHHYETFDVFGNIPAYAVHLDNGRSFGKTKFDDDDILMPLRQCCVIRPGTMDRLMELYSGKVSLSQALHDSMSKDPVAPVLAYKHYPALERRLHKIMQYLLECFDKTAGAAESVVMNEYHNALVAEEAANEDETKDDDTAQQQAPQQEGAGVPPPVNKNASRRRCTSC
ncbi:Fam20C domain-containing protein [Aphelenchoides bicaudatus]|nr:Fam20C domain-containing protein [Aphelenchoides bicaudatus]